MQYILLIIGIFLIVSAVVQVFLKHDKANAALLLLPGVLALHDRCSGSGHLRF